MKIFKTFIFALILSSSLSLSSYANQSVEEIIKGRKAMFSENYQNAKKISILLRSGKKEEAYKLLIELLDRRNSEYIKGGILARFFTVIDDKEKAFKWLKISREEKDTDFFHMYHWPIFDGIRNNSEFIKIYKDAGLFEYLTNK